MIFVTVGTHTQGFDRLLKEIDRLVENKRINENIFVEISNSNYLPKNYNYTRLLPHKRYKEMIKKADIVITHAGLGSVIDALSNNKPLIVVPRLKKFEEHVDDHQLELGKILEREKKAVVVYKIDSLDEAIRKVRKLKTQKNTEKKKLIETIESFLNK
jgi:UDP-N-acetylglucosamine transferase subunit ALG13